MLTAIKNTYAYKRAEQATELAPFKDIKLASVVEKLGEALTYIHSNGFFSEYTKHGPEHTAAIIASYDWLIEDEQKEHLTHADYLFLVLASSLHDLGMFVSSDEYRNRDQAKIDAFADKLSESRDGRAFLSAIPRDFPFREQVIYEEFVRQHHARRIRDAIMGDRTEFGDVSVVSGFLQTALSGLTAKGREELAIICESHHKSNIEDLTTYKTKSVHGQSPDAQINMQALCILLRAADVLQIGTGRTPSIGFSLVNPTNPISQLHWTKEMGVTRVLGQLVKSQTVDGVAERKVFIDGYFDEAQPFFALMNHLKFVNQELQKCVRWSRAAQKEGVDYIFKWTGVDYSNVETKGFVPQEFSFKIDREKILKLLVGHTLYNDSRVVLRELVQNSLDAVSVDCH